MVEMAEMAKILTPGLQGKPKVLKMVVMVKMDEDFNLFNHFNRFEMVEMYKILTPGLPGSPKY